MATIRKRSNKYHVQIRKNGHAPITQSFIKLADAQAWARKLESEIERGCYIHTLPAQQTLIEDILNRYAQDVVPTLRSQKPVLSALKHLQQHLGQHRLISITSTHLAAYRNKRLQVAAAQTVKHELGILNRILKKAHTEWGIALPHGVPNVRMPKLPTGRNRRLQPAELKSLLSELNPRMQQLVQFAIETGMRRGEIVAMCWQHIDLDKQLLFIPETKTDSPRIIPLSQQAIHILQAVCFSEIRYDDSVFGLRADSISQAFRRACCRAKLENLRFHDLRHEATSRFFELGLHPVEVAAITGHKDLRMLMRYTHLRAENLVAKLDQVP